MLLSITATTTTNIIIISTTTNTTTATIIIVVIIIIIIILINLLVFPLQYCVSKLTVLELLLKIAHHVSDEIILDRLLPYMLFLINDSLPQVRAQALKILSHCLQLVRSMPRSDANIFPEYVLPSLSWLTQDQEVIVRIAYAENIASLAETALKFLEMAQLDYANQESDEDDDAPIQYQVTRVHFLNCCQ